MATTKLITAVVVTFFLTCVSTLVISSLFSVLVMKRSLKAQRSKLRKQPEPAEGAYEMVNTEKKAEAEYEVMDLDKEVVKP